jgi:hypothetical protein
MSRIGRDQEDRAAIRKRLRFAGITIMTPSDGVVTDLTDGIRIRTWPPSTFGPIMLNVSAWPRTIMPVVRRREEVAREIERVVDAIAKGVGDLAILGPGTFALRAEKDALDCELAEEPAPIIALHPAALARYEEQIRRLQETIRTWIKTGQAEAAQIIRELIESVTVRRPPDGVEVEVKGRLNALLGEEAVPNGARAVGESW